jgi:hypothetical protein
VSERRKQRGSTMVEAGILYPLLVTLVFGVAQYAAIFSTKLTVRHALATALRPCALANTCDLLTSSDVETDVTDLVKGTLSNSTWASVDVVVTTNHTPAGSSVTFTKFDLTYRLNLFAAFLIPGSNSDGTITLDETQLVVEVP